MQNALTLDLYSLTCYLDAVTAKPEEPNPETPTPLYSIGTPSSSDENLFEDVKAQVDDRAPIGISDKGTLKDDTGLKMLAQSQNDKEVNDDLTDLSSSGHLETAFEMTKLQKSFEVSLPQNAEGTDETLEDDAYLDSILNPPENPNKDISSSFSLSSATNTLQPNEQVDQNEKHELREQVKGNLHSVADLERCNLDMSQRSLHPMGGGSEKLSTVLQHLKSQLSNLR